MYFVIPFLRYVYMSLVRHVVRDFCIFYFNSCLVFVYLVVYVLLSLFRSCIVPFVRSLCMSVIRYVFRPFVLSLVMHLFR